MEICQVDLADLLEYENNSRTHDAKQVDQIAASIQHFGWTNPLLIDASNTIIAGHGRYLAAKKLGESSVPCIKLSHLTDDQRRAYVIADNKIALGSGWNEDMLRSEIQYLTGVDFDLDLTGFTLSELDTLSLIESKKQLTDPDAIPPVPVVPLSKLGDVWILGEHRVMCGDSTSIESVKVLMGGGLS